MFNWLSSNSLHLSLLQLGYMDYQEIDIMKGMGKRKEKCREEK